MSVVKKFRPATERLLQFAQTPLGEEVLEGVTAGGLVGMGLMMSDQSIEQSALQTALAMAGGVGLGMGGRRLGAYVGKKIHPAAYKDQNGLMAGWSRMVGQEGIFTGMKEGLGHSVNEMKGMLRKGSIDKLQFEFMQNPTGVAQKLGVREDQVGEVLDLLKKADSFVAEDALNSLNNQAGNLRKKASELKQQSSNLNNREIGELGDVAAEAMGNFADMMDRKPSPITGEHTGRALGRVWGDELGVATGIGLGAAIGQNMGWESEKDRKIRLLEEELGRR